MICCIFLTFIFHALYANSETLEDCLQSCKSSADIIRAGDNSYEEYNYQYVTRNPKYPIGFIVVKSTADVQRAVKCLLQLKYKFVVKCGGHSFEKYSYGDTNDWVIDLKYLDSVTVDERTKIATVGAGIRFKALMEKLNQMGNYGLPFGACTSVGISGYTLGGGFGPFSRKFGLMSDRVIEMEMVTADAKIIRANTVQHSGLFWALRGGGGGNFGIVTQYLIRTFDTEASIAIMFVTYNSSDFKNEFKQYQNWLKSNPSDSIGCLVSYSNRRKTSKFAFVIFESDSNTMWKQVNNIRQYFPEIQDSDVKIESFVQTMNHISFPYIDRNFSSIYDKAKSFFVSKFLTDEEVDNFVNVIKTHTNVSFLFETYGGTINRIGATETAFCHRNSLYVVQYSVGASAKNGTDEANKYGDSMIPQLNEFGEQLRFMSNGEAYVNYIDQQEIDPFRKYYCNNFNYLRFIKQYYDPRNVFRFPLSIPP